jgi:membrane protein implicated in regulation of membrane protease activity
VVSENEPADPGTLERWKSWKSTLVGKAPLSAMKFAVPEIIFPDEAVSLGPIKAKEVQSRDFILRIAGVDDPSRVKIAVEIMLELPEGLSLSSGVSDGQRPDLKILKLRVDGTGGFQSRRSETHTGTMWVLPGRGTGAVFRKIVVPITVTTEGPLAPKAVLFGAGGVVLLVAVALAVGKLLRARKRMISRPHAVIGRLVVINDPTGGRIGTINLEALGTKSSRLSLTVGKDKSSEVRLRHTSINSAHCTLEAYLLAGRLESYIEPIESARVSVNGERIKSRTRLADGARIEIGEFIYQFEDSQMYKKVEVVRRNGKRITGILDAAGMDASGFRLSPMDAVSPSERARVKFSDIRYAIFYRRVVDVLSGSQRPMPKPDAMKRVELMFKKGNTISGYVQREYVEGRRRYVELLPLETGSDIDYTVVDYSAVVEKTVL